MENKTKGDLVKLAGGLLCLNGAFLSLIYIKMIIAGVQISLGQNNNWSNVPFYDAFIQFHIPVLLNLLMFIAGVFLFFRKRIGWLLGTVTSISLIVYNVFGAFLNPSNFTSNKFAFLLVAIVCLISFSILISRNALYNLQITKPKVLTMIFIVLLIIVDIIIVRT